MGQQMPMEFKLIHPIKTQKGQIESIRLRPAYFSDFFHFVVDDFMSVDRIAGLVALLSGHDIGDIGMIHHEDLGPIFQAAMQIMTVGFGRKYAGKASGFVTLETGWTFTGNAAGRRSHLE